MAETCQKGDQKDTLYEKIKKLLRKNRITRQICSILVNVKRHGVRYTWRRVKAKLAQRRASRRPLYTKADLEKQKATVFSKDVKVSVLVPLYNTPHDYLVEMISSVSHQTYANWELCLADGSDPAHGEVEATVRALAETDPRIRYCRLEKNMGISGNTNACIEMATGDYLALFDHDDLLHPAALFEVVKAICDQDADLIYTDENTFYSKPSDAFCPHYKPDFSPDLLRSYNYICHFTVFQKALLSKVGGFRSAFDGSQDYDMILRLTEQAKRIVHIPKILYYWRSHRNSVASDVSAKPYTLQAARNALSEHLERIGLKGSVEDSSEPSSYRIRYEIKDAPLISIIIPNMDHVDVLEKCLESVETKSTYRNFEILLVENNSRKEDTFRYYGQVCEKYQNIRLLKWEREFNYSAINNFALRHAKGEYVILLNNDVEIITPSWIEEMLMLAQRQEVGAVGMKLYYPDDTVQHAGVILGMGGIAGHAHKNFRRGDPGYMFRLSVVQNLSAVTAACMLVKTDVMRGLGGFDEDLAVAFNDVDLCVRIRQAGYLVLFTPYAEAYHYESKSRGMDDTREKQKRFNGEVDRFMGKWADLLEKGDPYYNPNLSLTAEDFSPRS